MSRKNEQNEINFDRESMKCRLLREIIGKQINKFPSAFSSDTRMRTCAGE